MSITINRVISYVTDLALLRHWKHDRYLGKQLKPILGNDPFLYLLETSENLWFSWDIEMEHWAKKS